MKIALYDVDSKIPNLALMKLARHHIERGDSVETFFPLAASSYDKIYASKVFDFSDFPYCDPDQMEIGGTGWNLSSALPPEIESLQPDYSLYPNFKGNLGFTMRGCRFRCDFCVVPRKEGQPVSTHTISDLMVNDSDFLVLLDNDPFGNPDWRDRFDEIRDRNLRVNFSQGINIRIITEEQASALASLKFTNLRGTNRQATFAWDRFKDERLILRGIERCEAAGIKAYQMQFYILVGFDTTPEEDMHRIRLILDRGADPYVMPFDRSDPYQKRLARWVNSRIARTIPWDDYNVNARRNSPDENLASSPGLI